MNTDLPDLYMRSMATFNQRVHTIREDQWELGTPCPEWNVRALVNHVVTSNLWTPPLLSGKSIDQIGDRFGGDQLGENPKAAWDRSAAAATAAVQDTPLGVTVHLSFDDVPARDYIWQLFADLLIHSWDLAHAIGTDERLEPDLVHACATWFTGVADLCRKAGIVGPPPNTPDGAGPQTRLLAEFGRTATPLTTQSAE